MDERVETASSRVSRRRLIGMSALGSLGPAARAGAQIRQPEPSRPLQVSGPELKLARRITYGPGAEDIANVYGAGYTGYLEWQLNPDAIDDTPCNMRLAAYTTLALPTWQLYPLVGNTVTREIIEATILRAIYSRRQLLERMVEFWNDHFNTSINTVGIFKTADDRDVIRKHALGKFADMLNASAASPAMLLYLNNAQSTRQAPNQNYAREIMELHTLGVNGGYTQQDIVEVARCFTGWRYTGNTGDARGGTFFYDPNRHDNNAKIVLGNTIAAGGGMQDGITVMKILAGHPSTATFVSRKLIRWLLRYDPQPSLVADVAGEFTQTGGDIKALIRRILAYDNLRFAPTLFKRPFHFIVSGIRALNITMTRYDSLRFTYLGGMGQIPFNWGPPTGYPHVFEYWAGLPLPRWNFSFSLANSQVGGAAVNVQTTLLSGLTTAAQIVDRINTVLFAGEMPAADKSALVTYLLPDPPSTTRIRDAVGLAIASPAFQWY